MNAITWNGSPFDSPYLLQRRARWLTRVIATPLALLLVLLTAYTIYYYRIYVPGLPSPSGPRYLMLVQSGDWARVAALYQNPTTAGEDRAMWERLIRKYGPVQSFRHFAADATHAPLIVTRSTAAFDVTFSSGEHRLVRVEFRASGIGKPAWHIVRAVSPDLPPLKIPIPSVPMKTGDIDH